MRSTGIARGRLALALIALGAGGAQALTYSWKPSTAAYAAVSGTPLTFSATDDAAVTVALPFTFTYDSLSYASVGVSTNGILTLGTTSTSFTNSDLFNGGSFLFNVLAPWWDNLALDASGTVQSFTEGTPPNRDFVIQFGNFPDYSGSTYRLNWQVRLYEGSNRIQFIYGNKGAGAPSGSSSASVGIKGKNGLTGFFIDGTTGSRTLGNSSLNSNTGFPAAGTVFTFAPDTAAPLGLTAAAVSGGANLAWQRSRLTSLLRYRIWAGTSPASMAPRDSTASLSDTTKALAGLNNGTTYYIGVTVLGPGGEESGFAQVVSVTPTLPPTVSITSPAAGSLVQASVGFITLTSNAADADGTVSQVDYYRGATLIGSSTFGNPYTVSAAAVSGPWSLTARATDNLGATATSAAVSFTVNLSPTVTLTFPAAGAYARGTVINLAASASDPDGSVSLVEFFHEGVKIGEDNTAPFGLPWTPDTVGRYILTVRATDNSGGITTSAATIINVTRPPVVHFTYPLADGMLRYPQDSLTVSAMDSDGTVSRVDYYNGTLFLGSVWTGNPYRFTWNIPAQGSYTLIAKAYDNLGLTGKPDTVLVDAHPPPQVTLTSPTYFSAFATGSPIAITATAVSGGRPISQVRFYRDSVLIGSSSGPAYATTWANPPPGRYRLQAWALDDRGGIGYSQPVTVFVNDSAKSVLGGRVFITGHDADFHNNVQFITAGLDHLLFGHAALPYEIPFRKGARIALLTNNPWNLSQPLIDYPAVTFINIGVPGWDTLAFDRTHFDAVVVGTYTYYVTADGVQALAAKRSKFDAYFNNGGGVFAMSEYYYGQHYYDFLPAFGSATGKNIGQIIGRFRVTNAGKAIGLDSSIVNRDLTHTEFLNVDTVFHVFESYIDDGQAISIGASAAIDGGGGYVPTDSVVANPIALARDTVFTDTLCVRFTSTTAGAILYLTNNGGNPDTSSWSIANGASVCIDNSTRFLVIAKKPGWLKSDTKEFRYRRADQVAMPVPDVPAGYFRSQVCVRFTSATPGAEVRYTLDGGRPDTSSRVKANGDSVCLDSSRVIRVLGRKTGMRDSDTGSYAYSRMLKTAMPTLDVADSTWFPDSLCFRFSEPAGAHIHYTLDGSDPDTVEAHAHIGDSLCVDRTTLVRLIAELPNSIPSDENAYRYFRMDTVRAPVSNRPDSTGFGDTLCLALSSATPEAVIHYTLDGSLPDTSSPVAAGGGVCVDHTVRLLAIAVRKNWITSPVSAYNYLKLPILPRPTASRVDSTWFADTLCVRFATTVDSATLHYLVGSGRADTSSLVVPQGKNLCTDRNVQVRVSATKPGWFHSDELTLRFFKMDTAAAPTANPGDSTWFTGKLCVRLSSSTAGAGILYTVNAGDPSATGIALAGGDSVCVDDTVTVRALARKPDWVDSRPAAFHYIRMQKAATPEADKRDSTYFPDRVCIRYSSATEGARIRYTMDGGRADTSSLSIANGDTLCVDRTARIDVAATLKNWIPSDDLALNVFRMDTVAVPKAGVPDSAWFRNSLCVPWTTATPGAAITVRKTFPDDNGKSAAEPDTAGTVLLSGDSVCLDRSAELRAVASLKNWKESPEAVRSYFRMDTVAKPVFGLGDTVFYPSICVKVSISTPGADFRYTMDGGDPDTSRSVKHGGDTLCTDQSTRIRVVGERAHSVSSEEADLRLEKMPQIAPLKSNIGDSAVFAHRLCFTLSSATDSVRIRYTLGGGDPMGDTLSMAGGDSVCVDRSVQVVAVGTRPLWRNSPEIRISLEVDNEGPRVLKAEKRPFDIQNLSVTGNCRGVGQDTLKVVFSERLFPKSTPPRWDRMLLFSPSCDTGDGLPLRPVGEPVLSGDGLEATYLLDNAASDEKPKVGNCLSLDWRSGEFPDRVGNPPLRSGVRIEGRENAAHISQIRAYPPVVGLENAETSRAGCSDEGVQANTWIPPVGFDLQSGTIDPGKARDCQENGGDVSGVRKAIPPCMSIVEVVTDGPYVAHVNIFDQMGNFIQGSQQRFGACGELDNLQRSVAGKKRSYLVWNTRGRNGDRAGNGAYVWRISFQTGEKGERGTQTVLIRTGLLRNPACAD
jgi:hypothetical protein